MMRTVLTGLMLLFLLVGCTSSRGGEDELRAASRTWIEAFNAEDSETLASLYTRDAMLLPPNSEPVRGRAAIRQFWAGFMEGVYGALDVNEVHVHDDMANVLGTFSLTADGAPLDRGKYVEIWKRTEGGWRIYRDIFNSSLPASP